MPMLVLLQTEHKLNTNPFKIKILSLLEITMNIFYETITLSQRRVALCTFVHV